MTTSTPQFPALSRDEGVHVLHLGDGEQRFSPDWMLAVHDLLGQVREDPAPVVTTATGKVWSNGLDLEWLQANPTEFQSYLSDAQHLMAAFLELPVPTVAAVQGHCFAAGAMLSLCHDQRVMRADRGWWCLPEIDLDLPFTPGMNALCTSRLTPATAVVAMTTGHRYTGEEALAGGIVERLAPEGEVASTALDVARGLTGKNPDVLGQIKQAIHAEVLGALRGADA
jgi:enoyl-CoA hydratase/carnithine racemase